MNNLPQSFSGDLTVSSNLDDTISKPARISAQELHKYVLGLVGVFVMIVITYPIAMNRVAQKDKFAPYQSHLKSLTLEYKPVELQSEPSASPAVPAQVMTGKGDARP